MSRPRIDETLHQSWWGRRHQASRRSLSAAAARYASHGWAVIPGSFFDGQRFDCGRPGCQTVGCHPAIDGWEARATDDAATVCEWWRDVPYTVLLATGRAFDVLEVPASMGMPVFACLPREALGGPIAASSHGRWMFLVRTGFGLAEGLAGRADVVLHSTGSWVPAPPMRYLGGRVAWRLHPRSVGYGFADPILIQSLIIAALPAKPPAIDRAAHGHPNDSHGHHDSSHAHPNDSPSHHDNSHGHPNDSHGHRPHGTTPLLHCRHQ